jgi:hypothetical protein
MKPATKAGSGSGPKTALLTASAGGAGGLCHCAALSDSEDKVQKAYAANQVAARLVGPRTVRVDLACMQGDHIIIQKIDDRPAYAEGVRPQRGKSFCSFSCGIFLSVVEYSVGTTGNYLAPLPLILPSVRASERARILRAEKGLVIPGRDNRGRPSGTRKGQASQHQGTTPLITYRGPPSQRLARRPKPDEHRERSN